MDNPKIIFLNGYFSVRKNSLVKAIQYLSEEFWLVFGVDDSIDAMPSKYWGSGEKSTKEFHFVSRIVDKTNNSSLTNTHKDFTISKKNKKDKTR